MLTLKDGPQDHDGLEAQVIYGYLLLHPENYVVFLPPPPLTMKMVLREAFLSLLGVLWLALRLALRVLLGLAVLGLLWAFLGPDRLAPLAPLFGAGFGAYLGVWLAGQFL